MNNISNKLIVFFLLLASASVIVADRSEDLSEFVQHGKALDGRSLDLSNVDLREAIKDLNKRHVPINLENANLVGANLVNADLGFANLDGANLRNTKMTHVFAFGVRLNGADLEDADLSNADLDCAKLKSANLKGANLKDASLSSADLSGTHLSGAQRKDADVGSTPGIFKLLIFAGLCLNVISVS